jgi:hypothetical protein
VSEALPNLLQRLGLRSLLDAPCGDAGWINDCIQDVDYTGVDVASLLIVENTLRAERGEIAGRFLTADITHDSLPGADLILCRDCLVHLSFENIHRAVAHLPQNALSLLNTLFLAEIADALGRDAKAAEGLWIIDEALARSERNEERWCVAELLRIKGELILREGAPQAAAAAEEHFLRSLGWARGQGALSWELRTSTSLARLQQDQGRAAEARSLLQSVYDRFSEGFETADLKTAKAHLDSMQ